MIRSETILHNSKSNNLAAIILLPLLFMMSVPGQAGVLNISFTATISNDGGATTDDIFGSFSLDTDLLFGIGVGAVEDIVLSGSFTSSLTGAETADAGSAFTFVTAALRPGYGVLSLIGDYGTGFFALDLASDDFFTTTNVFDDLVAGLALGDLRAFTPAEALGTTRFVNFVGYSDEWEGALTSLSVMVPEPATLWLMFLMLPGIAFWRRRA